MTPVSGSGPVLPNPSTLSPFVILHLSDLHFGWKSIVGMSGAKVARSVSEDVKLALKTADWGVNHVSLVIVSGDLTEVGHPREFEVAHRFLETLSRKLKVPRNHFVVIPGNHDIYWPDTMEAAKASGKGRRRMREAGLLQFSHFYANFYGSDALEPVGDRTRALRIHEFDRLNLSIAAMNSCERESHRGTDHKGSLSRAQADALMRHWRPRDFAHRLKAIVIHHNPTSSIESVREDYRRLMQQQLKDSTSRERSEGLFTKYTYDTSGFEGVNHLWALIEDAHVQIVLHGHQHAYDASLRPWRSEGAAYLLSTGTTFSPDSDVPTDQRRSIRLVLVDALSQRLRSALLTEDRTRRLQWRVTKGGFGLDYESDHPLFLPPDLQSSFSPPPQIRFDIWASEQEALGLGQITPCTAVSPDGRRIVFVARDAVGVTRLYLRRVEDDAVIRINRSDHAVCPFFSDDGQTIGFFKQQQLCRIDIPDSDLAGTGYRSICEAVGARGATWQGDRIVFCDLWGTRIQEVNAGRRRSKPAVVLERGTKGLQFLWPQFIPGTDMVLLSVWGESNTVNDRYVGALDLETLEIHRLRNEASSGKWCRDHLVYAHTVTGTLRAVRMELPREGVPQAVGSHRTLPFEIAFDRWWGLAQFSVSPTGVLTHVPPTYDATDRRRPVFLPLAGSAAPAAPRAANEAPLSVKGLFTGGLAISPDGTRFVALMLDETQRLRVFSTALNAPQGLQTSEEQGSFFSPVWSPDGRSIVATREMIRDGKLEVALCRFQADRQDDPEIIDVAAKERFMYASSWSASLNQLTVVSFGEDGRSSIYLYPNGEKQNRKRLDTRHGRDVDVALPNVSPCGRLVAFSAQRGSEPWKIVIQPMDDPDGQCWFGEGRKPVWGPRPSDPSVAELFFIRGRALHKARIRPGLPPAWLDEECVFHEIPWLWEYQENPSYAITPPSSDITAVLMVEPRADEFNARRIKVALGLAQQFFGRLDPHERE